MHTSTTSCESDALSLDNQASHPLGPSAEPRVRKKQRSLPRTAVAQPLLQYGGSPNKQSSGTHLSFKVTLVDLEFTHPHLHKDLVIVAAVVMPKLNFGLLSFRAKRTYLDNAQQAVVHRLSFALLLDQIQHAVRTSLVTTS